MQLVANQQLVRNRARLGTAFHIAALAVFALLGALLVALRFPETARRDLDETSGEAPATATAS
jgi:hypothetical protein